jgi:hypothetical protein
MNITVGIVIAAITLVAGEITKLFKVDSKWIPLQNLIIATLSSVICIVFKVEEMSVLETILFCLFATLGAGGAYDVTKVFKKGDE